MPRPLEPNQRFPLVLPHDRDKSAPPTFYFRAASARQYMAAVHDAEQRSALLVAVEFLTARLVDWENMVDGEGQAIPFDASELDAVCDVNEIIQLFYQFNLGSDDKKKSA